MNVLLLHLDGSLPNLALMRIAAHHRAAGNHVELRRIKTAAGLQPRLGDPKWDRVYGSLIFEKTRPLVRTPELVAFQRWVIQRHDKHKTWDEFWGKARGEPRRLGARRVTLPLFPDGVL